MADILGRQEQVFGGGLTSDASWMFWGGLTNGGLGMLVTQMQIQYQQPVRRIYEIGPWLSDGMGVGQPVYYVAGRPEGSLQLSRITGPMAALGGFYRNYGSICSFLNSLFFVSSSGCIGGGASAGPGLEIQNPSGALLPAAPFVPGVLSPPSRPAFGSRADPFLGWYMNGCVITGMGLAAQSQDMMVTENVAMMFISLRLFVAAPGADLSGFVWTEL